MMHDQARPLHTQQKVLDRLVARAGYTKYGKQFGLPQVKKAADYKKALPVVRYDDLKPYIRRMMDGEADVLVPGTVMNYSKSSGTTSDVSKFIPVPAQNRVRNHIKGSWDNLALFYRKQPKAQLFQRKSLLIAGSISKYENNPKVRIGDISALLAYHIPPVGRPFFAPDVPTAILADWNEKLYKITRATAYEDMAMIGGVPTWLVVLCQKILEYTGKKNMLEVWPNLQAYFHGGVGFGPYKEQFRKLIPSDNFIYQEIYNASEGFFAVQDQLHEPGMMLFINNAIYYEFVPEGHWENPDPPVLDVSEIELNKPYAILISSNNGLMRYMVGDVVQFTSLSPLRLEITGRIKHFINVFGEEVMVHNTDQAIAEACQEFGAHVSDYSVAPIYLSGAQRGGHEWLIEFETAPVNMVAFANYLDQRLRAANSDYNAKRTDDIALQTLKLTTLPVGSFHKWLDQKRKLGAQTKVPRLCNDRRYVDEILDLVFQKSISS
jgi:hypothetical protein